MTIATRAPSPAEGRGRSGREDLAETLAGGGTELAVTKTLPPAATGRGGAGRGEALARELGARHCRIEDLDEDACAVIVQATSAPLDDPVVPDRALRAAFVLDLRYTPLGSARVSALCEAAGRLGVPAADGLGMLIRQAGAQIRIFTGREAPFEVLVRAARGSASAPSL